jgi:hypothetical protein
MTRIAASPNNTIPSRATERDQRQHVGKGLGRRLLRARRRIAPEEKNDALRGGEKKGDSGDIEQEGGNAPAAGERQQRRRDDDEGGDKPSREARAPPRPDVILFPPL